MPNPLSHLTPAGHGETAVGTSAAQLRSASTPARMVHIKALEANTNDVFIGLSNAVTASDGSTDTTSGYQLGAGDDIQLWVGNLDDVWLISDAASQAVTYFYYR